MKTAQTWIMILCLGYLGGFVCRNAQADEWNKKTTVTFSQAVEVPGKVLPAGTYTFKLLDSQSNRNIVQIFNKDESHLYATILAIPDYRMEPTGKTVIKFAERPSNLPEAVQAWFYPGDNYGQEFVYPKNEALELAKVNQQPVYSMPNNTAANVTQPSESTNQSAMNEMEQTPVTPVQPPAEEQQMAQATPPPENNGEAERQAPDNNAPAAEPPAETTAPAPVHHARRQMPKTASPTWLYLLMGLGSLTAGMVLVRSADDRA